MTGDTPSVSEDGILNFQPMKSSDISSPNLHLTHHMTQQTKAHKSMKDNTTVVLDFKNWG